MRVLLNILLVSILEEGFLILMSLRILKRFDLLKWTGKNIIGLSCLIMGTATVSNLLRLTGIDHNLLNIIGLLIMFLLFFVYTKEKLHRAFLSMLFSFILFMGFEFITFTLILYSTGKVMSDLNSGPIQAFFYVFPERIIEYSIIALSLLGKIGKYSEEDDLKVDVIGIIFNHKKLTISTAAILLFNFFAMLVFGYAFAYERILTGLDLWFQLLLCTLVLVLPISSFAGIWLTAFFVARSYEAYNGLISKK